MNSVVEKLELFRDLARMACGPAFFDFHNDFDFSGWSYSDRTLIFCFTRPTDDLRVELTFRSVDFLEANFDNSRDSETLTLDTLYRGRLEIEGALRDVSADGRFCIYFDFIDGFDGRFLCEGLEVTSSI